MKEVLAQASSASTDLPDARTGGWLAASQLTGSHVLPVSDKYFVSLSCVTMTMNCQIGALMENSTHFPFEDILYDVRRPP